MAQNLRKRESQRPGMRWVDENYDLKQEIKKKVNGPMPKIPAFTTSAFRGSDQWSEENLPDILFYLQPPPAEFEGREPQAVLDEDGQVQMSPNGKSYLRRIPILPDQIAVDVTGWKLVAWRRLDPRITLQDILDRMTTDLGEAQDLTKKEVVLPKKNSLQTNCSRNCGSLLGYYNAYARRSEPHKAEVQAMQRISMNNIKYNTVLPYNAKFNRLVKVKFVRAEEAAKIHVVPLEVTEDNLSETTFPVDHFLYEGYLPEMTENMSEAVSVLFNLQERAVRHGLNPLEWTLLNKSCLPDSWYDRTKEKAKPKDTYDGGCETCTWTGPADDDWRNVDWDKPLRRVLRKKGEKSKSKLDHVDSDEEDESDLSVLPSDDQPASASYSLSTPVKSAHKRKASETESSPSKRFATGHSEQNKTTLDTNIADEDIVQAGAWSVDQLQQFNNSQAGVLGIGHYTEVVQTPGKGIINDLDHISINSRHTQYAAQDDGHANAVTSLSEKRYYTAEELRAEFDAGYRKCQEDLAMANQSRRTMHSWEEQGYVYPPVTEEDDPFLPSLSYDRPSIPNNAGALLDEHNLYSTNETQPIGGDLPAAGVG